MCYGLCGGLCVLGMCGLNAVAEVGGEECCCGCCEIEVVLQFVE